MNNKKRNNKKTNNWEEWESLAYEYVRDIYRCKDSRRKTYKCLA